MPNVPLLTMALNQLVPAPPKLVVPVLVSVPIRSVWLPKLPLNVAEPAPVTARLPGTPVVALVKLPLNVSAFPLVLMVDPAALVTVKFWLIGPVLEPVRVPPANTGLTAVPRPDVGKLPVPVISDEAAGV